uniref:Ubiquitin-like domain-containing protein n=1 Tax=Sphenodon punctatus TaxID=8508 RepID=A0A8D0GQV2_SPHPU
MLLTVKMLLGQQCHLQVSREERISVVKSLVSEELKVPVSQQRLLFQGKVLEGECRLSDYPIGPEAKLHLVIKKPEQTYLDEPSMGIGTQSHSVWYQLSQVLEKHFRTSDAVKVLEQVLNDYYKGLNQLSLGNIEEMAVCVLHSGEAESVTGREPQQQEWCPQAPFMQETRRDQATQTEPQGSPEKGQSQKTQRPMDCF